MDVYVSPEILKTTDRCNKDFFCLTANGRAYCRIILSFHNSVEFHKCLKEDPCNYKEAIDSKGYKCTCPVRIDLCNRRDFW